MNIGNVIKRYRQELGFTQEEVAKRLGVTTPAVNKWENGNTQPDISLIAPIARLFGITTDTLLSFKDDLTDEEVNFFIKYLEDHFNDKPFEQLFTEAADKIKEYPSCDKLKWNIASMLDAWLMFYPLPEGDKYDSQIYDWFSQLLDSEVDNIKKGAALSLYRFYYKKEEYNEAEIYLAYLSEDDPERKSLHADILSKTGRTEEAFRKHEAILLKHISDMQITLSSLYTMYKEQGNMEMTHKIVDKQCGLAELFEMGKYHAAAPAISLAEHEKDVEETEHLMRMIIDNTDSAFGYTESDLFSHVGFEIYQSSFVKKLKDDVIERFKDENVFGYMKGNEFWEKLRQQ